MPSVLSPPTGDVTLIFTDIEGSSRASSLDEAAFLKALSRHNALVERLARDWDGYIVKNLGDGYFLAFSDLENAAAYALALQRELQRQEWIEGGLRVRIGIHAAEITPQAGDYFGSDVNLAQRVSDAGHGDMILLSPMAAERLLAAPLPDTDIVSLGSHRLKNLSEPYTLYRLIHPDLRDREFPPLRTLTAIQHNFPAQLTAFVGRDEEVTELKRLLTVGKRRLMTLTGMGGVGKSRVAMQAALDSLEWFPGGMWRVEFAEVRDASEVPDTIATALKDVLTLDPNTDTEAQVLSFFREKQALLLLENFERVIEAAPFVSELIQNCPCLTLLITSQQLLQIGGEREMMIEPMAVPPLKEPYETLLHYDSARLFVERAANARANFALTPENAPAIATLCRELEGLPLSLELTAALVRALTPQQLVPQLSRRFRLIAASRPDLEPRLRSLRGAIDWSYDLLTKEERSLYADLGVFVGGFSLEEVEAVCEAPDAFFQLLALRDKSLLKAEEKHGLTRYLMLTTLREYALEKLGGTERLIELRERHAHYFLAQAETLASDLERDPQGAMNAFALEAENMNAGLKFLEEQSDHDGAARYGAALGRYYLRCGPYALAERLLEKAEHSERLLFAQDEGRHRLRLARVLLRRGAMHLRRGENEQCELCMAECLPLFEASGDTRSAIASQMNRGSAAFSMGRLAEAKAQWEAALEKAKLAHSGFVGTLLMDLAMLEALRRDYTKANQYAEQALKIRRDSDPEDVAYVMLNLGEIQVAHLDSLMPPEFDQNTALQRECRINLEKSLQLCEALGNRQGMDRAQVALATLAFLTGDLSEAQTRIETAFASAQENDDRECLFTCLEQMGRMAVKVEESKAAVALPWSRALAMAKEMQSIQRQCLLLEKIGEVCEQEGEGETANFAYALVEKSYDELGMLPPKHVSFSGTEPPALSVAEFAEDVLRRWRV